MRQNKIYNFKNCWPLWGLSQLNGIWGRSGFNSPPQEKLVSRDCNKYLRRGYLGAALTLRTVPLRLFPSDTREIKKTPQTSGHLAKKKKRVLRDRTKTTWRTWGRGFRTVSLGGGRGQSGRHVTFLKSLKWRMGTIFKI